ncbi:hypothetical protein ACS0TY_016584 [Phlomoides rotata]
MLGKKLGSMKKLAKKVKVADRGRSHYECLLKDGEEGVIATTASSATTTPTGTFVVYVGEERQRFVVPTGCPGDTDRGDGLGRGKTAPYACFCDTWGLQGVADGGWDLSWVIEVIPRFNANMVSEPVSSRCGPILSLCKHLPRVMSPMSLHVREGIEVIPRFNANMVSEPALSRCGPILSLCKHLPRVMSPMSLHVREGIEIISRFNANMEVGRCMPALTIHIYVHANMILCSL